MAVGVGVLVGLGAGVAVGVDVLVGFGVGVAVGVGVLVSSGVVGVRVTGVSVKVGATARQEIIENDNKITPTTRFIGLTPFILQKREGPVPAPAPGRRPRFL